jgi:hypothetical protein
MRAAYEWKRECVFVCMRVEERVCVCMYESGRESVHVGGNIISSQETVGNMYYIQCNPAYLVCGHGFCSVICDVALDAFSL